MAAKPKIQLTCKQGDLILDAFDAMMEKIDKLKPGQVTRVFKATDPVITAIDEAIDEGSKTFGITVAQANKLLDLLDMLSLLIDTEWPKKIAAKYVKATELLDRKIVETE